MTISKKFGGYTVSAEVFEKVKGKAKELTLNYKTTFPRGSVSASFVVNEALKMVLKRTSLNKRLDKKILGNKYSLLEKNVQKWGKSYLKKVNAKSKELA